MQTKFNLPRLLKLIFASDLTLPLLLLSAYIALFFVIRGVLPTSEELITLFSNLYDRFGYQILFIAAMLEGLVLINFFTPGQVAMALGVVFSKTGQTELTLVVVVVSLGSIVGYTIDYLLGRFGFSEIMKQISSDDLFKKAQGQMKKHGLKGLIISYFHSNIASFMSLAAGAKGMPFSKFLFIATTSTIFWSVIWALSIYVVGDLFLTLIRKYSLLLMVLAGAFLILTRFWKGGKGMQKEN